MVLYCTKTIYLKVQISTYFNFTKFYYLAHEINSNLGKIKSFYCVFESTSHHRGAVGAKEEA